MIREQQYIHIDAYGNRRIYKDRDMNILHCTDGPAVEYSNGTKAWHLDGKLHRIDGPAVEYTDGSKAWYLNDKRHRSDGPAVEGADGTKEWYVDDERINEKEFNNKTTPTLELTLEAIAAKFGVDVSKLKIVK